jgi:transposase-like protein
MSAIRGHGAKLPRKKEQAIAALLTAPSIEAAAQAIGVANATLRRWLADPGFKAEYMAARRDAVSQAVGALQRACLSAVETLRDIMTDKDAPHHARVASARAVLEGALRGIEVEDVLARLDVLEQARAEEGR